MEINRGLESWVGHLFCCTTVRFYNIVKKKISDLKGDGVPEIKRSDNKFWKKWPMDKFPVSALMPTKITAWPTKHIICNFSIQRAQFHIDYCFWSFLYVNKIPHLYLILKHWLLVWLIFFVPWSSMIDNKYLRTDNKHYFAQTLKWCR